jgi:putative ABC transport system permease protein
LGILNRAVRNISRRKMRALLVIIALGFSLAIMVSIPAGVVANQQAASRMETALSNTITQTGQSINQTLNQITCSIASGFGGFGFTGGNGGSTSGGTGGLGRGGTSGGGGYAGYGGFGGFGGFGNGSIAGQFGAGAFGGGQANPMNETLYSDINNTISGVAVVEPILQVSEGQNETVSFFGRSFTRMVPEYIIEGVPLTSDFINNYPILPTNITAGQSLQAGDSGDVLLSENNSAYFGVGVGGTVNILGTNFKVVGVYSPSGVEGTEMLYMNLSEAQALTNNTGYITSLTVFTQNTNDVSSVANTISSLHPELTVTTGQERLTELQNLQSGYNTALTNAQNSLNSTNSTAVEEIIVVVAATSLIVLFVMLYTVRERTKEIGTLKAIGFSNSAVMGQFMLEGVLLSAIAGVVGIAIGVVAAPTLSSLLLPSVGRIAGVGGDALVASRVGLSSSVTLSPELILIALGVAILLGTIGSLYPAWRAAKIKPAEAMRYE